MGTTKARELMRGRCFLYLVNYARMKPEIALKALPTLLSVCFVRPSHQTPVADLTNRTWRIQIR